MLTKKLSTKMSVSAQYDQLFNLRKIFSEFPHFDLQKKTLYSKENYQIINEKTLVIFHKFFDHFKTAHTFA